MQTHIDPHETEQWVIWNGTSRILAMVSLGQVDQTAEGRQAWLAKPYHMVGPFNLDVLETEGRISFAACIVMSRQRWQEDQTALRREAFENRRAAQRRMFEEASSHNAGKTSHGRLSSSREEKQHRETLYLPIDGKLAPSQIKTAFRRLAQKMHPDVGGSHEQFLRITEARNALLEWTV